jgi:glutathione S-transferase
MITLYHAPQSRSSRIIWLLEELEAPYEIRPVSIFRPFTGEGSPDPANPHPDKRVPAILDNGVLVAESIAIVLYLTDRFPAAQLGRHVGDPGRGDYLTWLAWYAAEMEPAMMASFGGELAALADEAAQPRRRREADRECPGEGSVCPGRPFLGSRSGDQQRDRLRPQGLSGQRRDRRLCRPLQGAPGRVAGAGVG